MHLENYGTIYSFCNENLLTFLLKKQKFLLKKLKDYTAITDKSCPYTRFSYEIILKSGRIKRRRRIINENSQFSRDLIVLPNPKTIILNSNNHPDLIKNLYTKSDTFSNFAFNLIFTTNPLQKFEKDLVHSHVRPTLVASIRIQSPALMDLKLPQIPDGIPPL